MSASLFAFSLCLLWFRLIDHLRVEWSLNPQYTYGWAVPFLCAYLLWQRLQDNKTIPSSLSLLPSVQEDPGLSAPQRASPETPSHRNTALLLSVVCFALLYLPVRLIQEANPEWRLVSWALALVTISLTLLLISAFPRSRFPLSTFCFPLFFFLVAVPWPTIVEGPLIQSLTQANAKSTVELLNLLGVPALQHGQVIEVAAGVVGIDEACSGIRSFQATLMISLFLGELYRLTVLRHVFLCLSGFALSFLFNVARTTLLTWVAAHKGLHAIATWHDPAGVTILVACFVSLFLIALWLRAKSKEQKSEISPPSDVRPPPSALRCPISACPPVSLSACLFLWLLACELGTEAWYRDHEKRLPPPVTWSVEMPRDAAGFQELGFDEKARKMLRYSEGLNARWREPGDVPIQAIFLRWKPGRTAVHLAKSHTPDACLTATGRQLTSKSDVRSFSVKGLALPVRSYVSRDQAGLLHVYYCLWEDRAPSRAFAATSLSYQNRLEPVLAGRRHLGQRSLEVAIWGVSDDQDADVAFQQQLEKLVVRTP